MPSGKLDKPVIQDNRDGTVSIHYEPREEGLHELMVKYNSEHVQGISIAGRCKLTNCQESTKLSFSAPHLSSIILAINIRLAARWQ